MPCPAFVLNIKERAGVNAPIFKTETDIRRGMGVQNMTPACPQRLELATTLARRSTRPYMAGTRFATSFL